MANKKIAHKSWLVNFGDGTSLFKVGDRFTYTLPNVTLQLKFVAYQEAFGILQFQDIATGLGFCFAPKDLPKSIKAVKPAKPAKKLYMVYEYTDFEGDEARPFFTKERALEAARYELNLGGHRSWDTIKVYELVEGEREGQGRLIARAASGAKNLTMV